MARTLQIELLPTLFVGWSIMMSACVVAPPIEPMTAEPNRPPRLSLLSPESPLITVTDSAALTFTARPLDPNNEDRLFYAWIGEASGVSQAFAGPTIDAERVDGVFYTFEAIELALDPCGEDLRGRDSETLWLYISDRPLFVRSETDIVTEDDGYIESFTWNLRFRPDICSE